ncbi:ROK family transcriptional regulator [Fictibacillus enclensis]|uniref:ROK family transcriptional regulator n=1 Tax=Fictibacillus enclensis TaxID=1017270 RepID=UPI0024BF653A|nr:ROK family protein [Fictibacillus enclensis]WHY72920.1 ROK family protein [Fictibacillus enclensis]
MQTITWNQQVVKRNNKSLVLQTIIEKEPVSRADIAQITGLNKATVSSLVNDILEENMIFESGPGESSGGRRPVLLHFNKTAGYAIGIDIGVNYVLSILTDLRGNIIIEKNQPIKNVAFEAVTDVVSEMIRSLILDMPESSYGVVGIGIGVPGIVDKQGTVLFAPNLNWSNISLKQHIEEKFKLPVLIENEANAGAYGEKQLGAGQSFQDIIYVSAGIGIGAGIILNGELYQGKNGYSGELGHVIIQANGKKCSCGSQGCWEVYASENALLEMAPQPDATLESLVALAEQNDPEAIALFEKIGASIGIGVNNIINAFNPEQVIIGNRLVVAKQWLEGPILETIQTHTLPFHQKEVQLQFSQLSVYSAALGVSAFVVENFIRDGVTAL